MAISAEVAAQARSWLAQRELAELFSALMKSEDAKERVIQFSEDNLRPDGAGKYWASDLVDDYRRGSVVVPSEAVGPMALAAGASQDLANTMTALAAEVEKHPIPVQRTVASQRAVRLQIAESAPRRAGRWYLEGESDLLISDSMIEAKYRQRGLDSNEIAIIQRISAERYKALVESVQSGTPTQLIIPTHTLESAVIGTPQDVSTYFDRLEGLIEAGAQVRLMKGNDAIRGVIYGEQAELVLDGSLGPQLIKTYGRRGAGSSVSFDPTGTVSLSEAWSATLSEGESRALLNEARDLVAERARVGQMLKRGEIPEESRRLLEDLAQYRNERFSMEPKDWSPEHRALGRAAEREGFRLRQLLCASNGDRLSIGDFWTLDHVAARVEIPPAVKEHLEALQQEVPHDRYTETSRAPATEWSQMFHDLMADATELAMHVRSEIPAALLPRSDVEDLAVRPSEIAELDATHARRLSDPKYAEAVRVKGRSRRILPSPVERYQRDRARLLATRELTGSQFTGAINELLERGGQVTITVDESAINRLPEARRERLLAHWRQLGAKGARFAVGPSTDAGWGTTVVASRSTGLPIVMRMNGISVHPGEANELHVLWARHDVGTALQTAMEGLKAREAQEGRRRENREYEAFDGRRVPEGNEVPPPPERRGYHAEALVERPAEVVARPPARVFRQPDGRSDGGRRLPGMER